MANNSEQSNQNQQLDWESGKWSSPTQSEPTAEIMITADWAPIRKFEPIISDDPDAVYGDLLPVLRKSDLRITNLECALTSFDGEIWKSGSTFKGLPNHVSALKTVPYEVVTTANNHVFDYDLTGFRETHEVLSDNGILSVGSGMSVDEASEPLVVTVKGIRIGVINFSEGEDLKSASEDKPGVFGWEKNRVLERMKELRPRVDLTIVICHCGVEYIPFPPPYVVDTFLEIADAGADLVIGHHPHVPQGVQIHNGVPICYSLGNFVFYQETELIYRKTGYMVKANVAKSGLSGIEIIPYEIGPENLSLLKDDKRDWFFNLLKEISTPLDSQKGVLDAWSGFLARYGKQGFLDEINMLLDRIAKEPEKGAAMFRNRVTSPQHSEHWSDALTKLIDGTIQEAPDWSLDILDRFMSSRR